MSDLVKRLIKRWEGEDQCDGYEDCDCCDDAGEAAGEIKRLREEIKRTPDTAWLLACMEAANTSEEMRPAANAIWAWLKAEAVLRQGQPETESKSDERK